jgi:hypothetical protein
MKQACRRIIIVCALLVLFLDGLHAQSSQTDTTPAWWLSAGLGGCTLGDLAGSAAMSLRFDRVIISMRTTANSAGLFDDEYYDLGLLVGYAAQMGRGHWSIAVGIASVTGTYGHGLNLFSSNESREKVPAHIGLPLEVQLFPYVSRFWGVGLYGYADVNAEQSFAGITLSLRLGKLR